MSTVKRLDENDEQLAVRGLSAVEAEHAAAFAREVGVADKTLTANAAIVDPVARLRALRQNIGLVDRMMTTLKDLFESQSRRLGAEGRLIRSMLAFSKRSGRLNALLPAAGVTQDEKRMLLDRAWNAKRIRLQIRTRAELERILKTTEAEVAASPMPRAEIPEVKRIEKAFVTAATLAFDRPCQWVENHPLYDSPAVIVPLHEDEVGRRSVTGPKLQTAYGLVERNMPSMLGKAIIVYQAPESDAATGTL